MGSLSSSAPRIIGRYALYEEIASGGMATVHFGRLLGVVGFAKTVAIKRLHPQLARDPEFVSMFLDEARLAARIRHPNVVSTLDVVALDKELFLVMEYVQGESLRHLERAVAAHDGRIPPAIAATIVVGLLHGLHAAHEAANEHGEPLGIVHRDVSPQNVMVGIDGVSRVFDFGVAKAAGRAQTTREGQLKGKLAYMAPEQLMGREVTRATDIFAASAVLWEALVGKRLFKGDSEGEIVKKVLDAQVEAPSTLVPDLPAELDAIVLRGLARRSEDRFATAREMARALEKCVRLAPASEVGEFVEKMAASTLAQRAERVARIESSSPSHSRADISNGTASGTSVPEGSVGSASDLRLSGSLRTEMLTAPWNGETPPAEPSSSLGALVTSPQALRPLAAAGALPRGRREILRRVVAGAVILACALLLVALGATLHGRPETTARAATTGQVVAAAPPVERASAETSEAPAQPPAPPSPPPVAVEPSDPGTSSAAATSAPVSHARVSSPAPRSAPRRAAVSCDPPYTIDANGFRHYKRECAQ